MRFRLWIRWTRKHYKIRYPIYVKQSSSVQQIQASLKCSEVPISCSSKMQWGWCISRAECKFLKLLVEEGKQIVWTVIPFSASKMFSHIVWLFSVVCFIYQQSVLDEHWKPLLLLFEKIENEIGHDSGNHSWVSKQSRKMMFFILLVILWNLVI